MDETKWWMKLNSPHARVTDIDVGIIGVPYDGSVTHESGAALAPHVLREISADRWPLTENGVNLEQLRVRDFGDVPVNNDDPCYTLESVTKAVSPLVESDVIPVVLGGDHSVTSAAVKAFHKSRKSMGILWMDSHPDVMDTYKGLKGKRESKWNHACALRRILEFPHINPENVLVFGMRDFTPPEFQFIKENSIDVVYAQDLHRMDVTTAGERIGQKFADVPVYISYDIDILDPAHAPGTGAPVPGGISSRFLFDILFYIFEREREFLKESTHFLEVAGVDIMEISPPQDVGQITSCIGISIIMNMLGYICLQKGLVQ